VSDRLSLPAAAVGAAGLVIVALLPIGASFADDNSPRQTDRGFEVSYTAGERDAAGHFMGGTELRNLSVHGGRLYAGNGYWKDQPGPEGPQPAQILVLDNPAARWRIERSLDERLPNGRTPRHLAVSALQGMTFSTDRAGRALLRPVSMLFAGTWDLSGASQVMGRNDTSGGWTAMPLPVQRVTSGIQQVRALVAHRDRQTGVDQVFAGNDPYGIFSGGYDDAAAGGIRWGAAPELDISRISAPSFPGLSLLRVTSFAECNGILYATIGQQIYRRLDGAPPHWELFYTNPKPGYSESGLRGLTAIANPSGDGQALLVAVEGSAARIVRIDPASGEETTELDIPTFLNGVWATKVGYAIAAYNDMAVVAGPRGEAAVLIGIEAFLPASSPVPAGHVRADGLDGGGWYFVRQGERRYDLRKIGSGQPLTGTPLVATRAIAASPFPSDADTIYFAGFDANKRAAHNTAWIFRAGKAKAILSTSAQER
jgi:poly(A) polymerase